MCLDKGYDYDEVRNLLAEFGFTAYIRARGEEANALKQDAGFRARRWVVERTRTLVDSLPACADPLGQEKSAEFYLGFLHLACAFITYRQSGLLG